MAQKDRSATSESRNNVSSTLAANRRLEASEKRDIFAYARERVDFLSYAQKNVELKRSGANYLGRCPRPDHPDENPSCTYYPDHAHCFSCGYHGDVIDVHGLLNNIESPYRAAESLCEAAGLEFPAYSTETAQIAAERRQRTDENMSEARRFHEALTTHPRIRQYWEDRGFSDEVQNRYLLGADGDDAATIPFWNRGEVHGLIRRNLSGEKKYKLPRNENLLDGHRPLFIPGKLGKIVCLVEGYADALTLDHLGFSAAAVGGTGMSVRERKDLERIIARYKAMVYILPDADEPGLKAARKWTTDLYPNARLCKPEYGTTKTTTEE